MIGWLILLALLVGQIFALRWWLNREYYPVLFNGWAVLAYSALLAADSVVAMLLNFFIDGRASGLDILVVLSVVAVVLVALFTLFFRWIVRQDLPDTSVGEKDRGSGSERR